MVAVDRAGNRMRRRFPAPLHAAKRKHQLHCLADVAVSWPEPNTSQPLAETITRRLSQGSDDTAGGSEHPIGGEEGDRCSSDASCDRPSLGVGEAERREDHDRREGSDE